MKELQKLHIGSRLRPENHDMKANVHGRVWLCSPCTGIHVDVRRCVFQQAPGSQNTVEPMLEEGPLDFVGRFWETVKPRDTAYVAGEHIGEIRKPGEKPEGPNPLAALKQAALAHGVPHELPNVNVQEKVQEAGVWERKSRTIKEQRSRHAF